jgi:predicted dehydrogenase
MDVSRRDFLGGAAVSLAGPGLGAWNPSQPSSASQPPADTYVQLPPLFAATETQEKTPGPFEAPSRRIGFAIVGLGHLSLNQILPAFGKTKYAKPAALVSGDRVKAAKVAAQYGIEESSIYNYRNYESIARNPDVQVLYIVLPNSMHAEYVMRGAKLGKHILCEKPMATHAKDCEAMIAACEAARIKLMIAYRQQYEPMNRAIVDMVRSGRLGPLRSILASNAQNQGDPHQWRQKIALSGGGCLPDVGIYCLNAARFISGEEPTEIYGATHRPADDPRFQEVEETCSFTLRFPSGLLATCSSGYGAHRSQFLRVEGEKGWAELSPAFGYTGLRLRTNQTMAGHDVASEPAIEAVDQFAQEMDHMCLCVMKNAMPHTPGDEGLQDQKIIEAIYASAREGKAVRVEPPAKPTRGPELQPE